ncbi:glutamate racemase [Pantoea sp. Mhis]|uniref:glutamate racemase n=1 Tax=Pantoea sp. Mhis TaxID=2576759 RepID=UPI00135B76D8|nr:glutamate racemase [Pantoea sp. Mhis]MXP56631.1 glutamate racemase [Pantoea sp. Mhis]
MFTQFLERNNTSLQEINPKLQPTILILDSGVGGLSIYKEIHTLLPNIRYLYVFDNANFPYGEKNENYILRCIISIIKAIYKKFPLSLAIIACNSASTIALSTLRKNFEFPIIGVVPAIKPAAFLTRNKIIGLLATFGTINRHYTHQLIKKFAKTCKVEMLGSSKLVNLAEAKVHGKKIIINDIKSIIEPWITMKKPPDTVILGCTHFPLLYDEIKSVLLSGTQLVDSRKAIARRTVWILKYQNIKKFFTAENIAFCTQINNEVMQLIPTLQFYGFSSLEKLFI